MSLYLFQSIAQVCKDVTYLLRNGTIYRNIFCFTKQPKAFPHKKKELSFFLQLWNLH